MKDSCQDAGKGICAWPWSKAGPGAGAENLTDWACRAWGSSGRNPGGVGTGAVRVRSTGGGERKTAAVPVSDLLRDLLCRGDELRSLDVWTSLSCPFALLRPRPCESEGWECEEERLLPPFLLPGDLEEECLELPPLLHHLRGRRRSARIRVLLLRGRLWSWWTWWCVSPLPGG